VQHLLASRKRQLWAALTLEIALIFWDVLGIGDGIGPGINHSNNSGLTAFFLAQIQRLECSGRCFAILPYSPKKSHNI